MIGHTGRIVIEAIIGVIAGVAILLGISFWRLSEGPISVDFLNDQLEAAFNTEQTELSIEAGETLLVWAGGERNLELRARDWKLVRPDGGVAATLPEMGVHLSVSALVNGTIAPTDVSVVGIELALFRRANGSFGIEPRVDYGEEDAGDDLGLIAPVVLQQLLSDRDPDAPLSYLERVSIRDAALTVRDEALGVSWTAPQAIIVLERRPPGLRASANFDVEWDRGPATSVESVLLYDRSIGSLKLMLSFDDFNPSRLANLAPSMQALQHFDLLTEGSITGAMFPDGRIETVSVDLSSPGGMVRLPEIYQHPFAVQDLALAATYTGADRLLGIEDLSFTFDMGEALGPVMAVSADLQWSKDGLDVSMETRATDVEVDDIPLLWPVDSPGNGRAWVKENVTAGGATDATIHARLSLPDMNPDELVIHRLNGGYSYHGVEVHYLRPLPPITDIEGTATFDADTMTFSVEEGHVGEIRSGPSTVVLTGLSADTQTAQIEFTPVAPLGAALELLNHPRLRLIEDLGLEPGAISGNAEAKVRMGFPLEDELTFDGVEVEAAGNLRQVAIRDLLLGQGVTEGDLDLSLQKDGMTLEGDALFAEIPVKVAWEELFKDNVDFTTRLDVTAPSVEATKLAGFGLDTSGYVEGLLGVGAKVRERRNGSGEATVTADLSSARLALPFLNWEKPSGQAANLSTLLLFDDAGLQSINNVDFNAGDFIARGAFSIDPESQEVTSGSFSEIRLGTTSLANTTVRDYGEGVAVDLGGGQLDLSGFFGEDKKAAADTPEQPPAEREEPYTPLRVTGTQLDRVILGEGRSLEGVNFELQRGPQGWEIIRIDGRVPRRLWRAKGGTNPEDAAVAEKRFAFDFGPGVMAEHSSEYGLLFRADDAGAMLRALDWTDDIEGGRLEVRGHSPAPLPKGPLQASVEATNYRLVEAPLLARLLSAALLTGIADLLSGEGIGFNRFTGDFTLEEGVMHTDLLRAYGPGLGITIKGKADFNKEVVDVGGTLVPAYSVNRILGAIPILGPILTGGEGGGVIGVVYSMQGPLGDPKISVNPLSALAPGFLRGLFEVRGDDNGEDSENRFVPQAYPEGHGGSVR